MTTAGTDQLGLALEGGGAKGAYHMGVMKAYREAGHAFGAITGTSIGALNGAVIAQGDFESGYRLWKRLDARSIFDMDEEEYRLLLQPKLDKDALRRLAATTRKVIASRGIDTGKMRSLIESIVNESQLRSSATDFGLVTVSLSDRAPLELYRDEIPHGRLVDYLMASASFPGFQSTVIDNKSYIDGGLYDNCPINMLAHKGYKQVIAVRTLGPGITRKIQYPDTAVTYIVPSGQLGSILNFSPEWIHRGLKMGYYDALRRLKGLQGTVYCVDASGLTEEMREAVAASVPAETALKLGRMLGVDTRSQDMWPGRVSARLAALMRLPVDVPTFALVLRLAEILAEAKALDKFAVYSFPDFIRAARTGPLRNTAGLSIRKVELCMAAQRILETVRLD